MVISELLVINNILKTVLTRLGRSRKFRKKGSKKLRGSPVHRKIWAMEILFISAQNVTSVGMLIIQCRLWKTDSQIIFGMC